MVCLSPAWLTSVEAFEAGSVMYWHFNFHVPLIADDANPD